MNEGACRIGFSVMIPTYNREKDLRECIDSILVQTLLPDEVLVIDDGNLPNDVIQGMTSDCSNRGIAFIYYRKDHLTEPHGTSESRNVGVKIARNDINFILDDDVILDVDFFERITQVWKENRDPNLIGVGGIIKNNRKKSKLERLYTKVFGLDSKHSWDVNDIAFQVWDDGLTRREKGYYTHGGGGASSYRKSLVQEVGGFSTFSGGRTALEDVDFSLRAKKQGYHSIMEPSARVLHKQSRQSREKQYLIGCKESQNRKSIFANNCRKSWLRYLRFYWANLGWILGQMALGNFSRAFGMIKGLSRNPQNPIKKQL